MQIVDGNRIDQRESGQPAEPAPEQQRDESGRDARALRGCGSTVVAAKIGAAITMAVGSPKRPLSTLSAVAAIAMPAKISAGTTSGRRRRTNSSMTTAIGAPAASATAMVALASSQSKPDRRSPKARVTAAVHNDKPCAGAARNVQPSPGKIHDT